MWWTNTLRTAAEELGHPDKKNSSTSYEPNDYFFMETYVESLTESMTEQRFIEQRFLEDVDYDDAAIGEMLVITYQEQVYHSQRRQCPTDRGNLLLKKWQKAMIERGNPLSTLTEVTSQVTKFRDKP